MSLSNKVDNYLKECKQEPNTKEIKVNNKADEVLLDINYSEHPLIYFNWM